MSRSKSGYPKDLGGSDDTSGSSAKSPNLGNTAAKMPRPKTIGSKPVKLAVNKTVSDELDSPTSAMGMGGPDDSSEKYILHGNNSPEGFRRPPSLEADTSKIMRTQEYEVEYHDPTRRQQDNRSTRSSRRGDVEHELGEMPRSRFHAM